MNAPLNTPPTYAYDTEHVNDAESGGRGKFIDESGAYVGTIVYARAVQSSKGGWGVEIGFATDDGRRTKYPPTLWTISATGERQFGHDILDCVLICCGMKPGAAMKPGKVKYTKFDFDLRAEVEAESDGYPAIGGKRIGLLIQRELYTAKSGKEAARHAIVGAFDAETRQAASEKIEGKPAELTEKRLATLKDRDSRDSSPTGAPAAAATASDAFAGFNDDIPF